MIDASFRNVLINGFAFFLCFTSFQTLGNIQKSLLDSINDDDKSYEVDGHVLLAIVYGFLSFFNLLCPPFLSLFGPRISMIIGSITYTAYIMNFLSETQWAAYLCASLIGIGAALIWTGQGVYLSLNSSKETISRNSGVFWLLLQMSLLVGNLIVYLSLKDMDKIEQSKRTMLLWILSGLCMAGNLVFIIHPAPRTPNDEVRENQNPGVIEALKAAGRLLITKDMMLLCLIFGYTGLHLSLWSGVYSSALSFTEKFSSRKELLGLSGILLGVGEVVGGGAFGIFGKYTTKYGRTPIIITGFVVCLVSYFLIFLNIPVDAVFHETPESAIIEPNKALALFCSFLLGFGDACYNTQIYSYLGGVYADESVGAFTIFKFVQSIFCSIAFAYALEFNLHIQIYILTALSIMGTLAFLKVELANKKAVKTDDSSSTASSE